MGIPTCQLKMVSSMTTMISALKVNDSLNIWNSSANHVHSIIWNIKPLIRWTDTKKYLISLTENLHPSISHSEYEAINSMLDQINSYLDDLEERNDSLNGKLHELMESNRQARQEFRAQMINNKPQEESADGESKEDLSGNTGQENKKKIDEES